MFLSRLQGQASVCDFTVKCSEKDDIVHSYADNMVAHQLVRGLEDIAQQEKVLALAATEGDLTLKKISKFVEAQETGLRSSRILVGGAGVQKINSDHRRGRSNTLPSRTPGNKELCNYCGRSGHGKNPSFQTRKEKCKASGQPCHSCSLNGHFLSMFKNKSGNKKNTNNVAANVDVDGEVGAVADIFNFTAPRHKKAGMRVLSHLAMNEFGKWMARNPEPQASVNVSLSVSVPSYWSSGYGGRYGLCPQNWGQKVRANPSIT